MERAADHRHHPPRHQYPDPSRQAFYRPRASLGATHYHRSNGSAGHLLHLLTVAAPLVIAEAIKDPDKRWRAMRGVTVGTALLSEVLWTFKISQDRKDRTEAREALKDCEERCL
jgi:hypothetical protein